MSTLMGGTFEGTVENGLIRLSEGVVLPDKAKVYVIVPGVVGEKPITIRSPRLAHPEQAADFVKEVLECREDAQL
jgi:hypothetical protein